MQRQPCRTCNAPRTAAYAAEYKSNPMQTFGLGLGVVTVIAIAMLALTALVHTALAEVPSAAPSAERQRELIRFVRQECGFCHGIHLTGGLGSPLTAQALASKPPEALEATILYGRTGTAMPGWTPHLSETDAGWIVAALLKGFPE
jgi:cytochrome c55X